MKDQYEQKLLDSWEDVFKKSQLTLWLLLALKDSPKHLGEIKKFISAATNGVIEFDDQSMYRALRKLHEVEIVSFTTLPGSGGPDLKQYQLSPTGSALLRAFVRRNIVQVYFKPDIKNLLKE